MKDVTYSELNAQGPGFYGVLAAMGAVAGLGLTAAWYMNTTAITSPA
jgi:hypothetical protein